jgi:hypothetical protein
MRLLLLRERQSEQPLRFQDRLRTEPGRVGEARCAICRAQYCECLYFASAWARPGPRSATGCGCGTHIYQVVDAPCQSAGWPRASPRGRRRLGLSPASAREHFPDRRQGSNTIVSAIPPRTLPVQEKMEPAMWLSLTSTCWGLEEAPSADPVGPTLEIVSIKRAAGPKTRLNLSLRTGSFSGADCAHSTAGRPRLTVAPRRLRHGGKPRLSEVQDD